jgi:hypothetical protein
MSIYIFSKKEAALKTILKKNASLVEFLAPAALAKHKPQEGDISYLDLSGFPAAEAKKTAGQLKKHCKDTPWGIIDLKGIKDPAFWFFEGASDYLGSDALKAADAKRFKTAAVWRKVLGGSAAENSGKTGKAPTGSKGLPKTDIKLPTAKFPGWKAIPLGKTMPFYLLHCSLQGKTALNTRLGEAVYTQLHKRLLAYLYRNFQDAEGLIWMDSGRDCLFLIPPKAKNAEAAVKASIRILLSAPLIAIETLGLTIPANFIFSFHYGSVSYKPPGKTGTVVSDAVNFVFHLGSKKAELGRLTISEELPNGSIPKSLEDCFVFAGEYEGRKIWHTKKFSYIRDWT